MPGQSDVDLDLTPADQTHVRPLNKKLSHKERRYIAFCEKFYYTSHGGFPSAEQASLALHYSVAEINVFLQNVKLQDALNRRGLPWLDSGQQAFLTSTQVAVAVVVSNFADTRPISAKLDQLGVNPNQYYAWLNNPEFQQFMSSLADSNLNNLKPEAVAAFSQLVRNGDFQAIKYYFDNILGLAKNQEVQNAQVVIQRLIDTVTTHVKDPAVLSKISKDLLGTAPVAASGVTLQLDLPSQEVSEENESG